MNDDYVGLYSEAERYELVMGAYASGDQLNFYRRQVARYGEPVLELVCGSGRLTIPLAKGGVKMSNSFREICEALILERSSSLSLFQRSLCLIFTRANRLRIASHVFDSI